MGDCHRRGVGTIMNDVASVILGLVSLLHSCGSCWHSIIGVKANVHLVAQWRCLQAQNAHFSMVGRCLLVGAVPCLCVGRCCHLRAEE